MNTTLVLFWSGVAALTGVGLMLLVRGVIGQRTRGRPHCRACWYDMTGATSLTCPECGCEHVAERQMLRSRLRWRPLVAGLLIAALGGYWLLGPDVRRRIHTLDEPWHRAVVPTAVWIAAMPRYDGADTLFANRAVASDGSMLGRLDDYHCWLLAKAGGAVLRDAEADPARRQFMERFLLAAAHRVDAAYPPLIDYGRDETRHYYERRDSLTKLGQCGPRAVPWLLKMTEDDDTLLMQAAVETLGGMHSERERLVPQFMIWLQDARVNHEAAQGIDAIGASAMPALIELLRDGDDTAKERAAACVGGMYGGSAAAPELVAALQSENVLVVKAAVRALGAVGYHPDGLNAEQRRKLHAMLYHDSLSVRRAAFDAIYWRSRPITGEAVPSWRELWADFHASR